MARFHCPRDTCKKDPCRSSTRCIRACCWFHMPTADHKHHCRETMSFLRNTDPTTATTMRSITCRQNFGSAKRKGKRKKRMEMSATIWVCPACYQRLFIQGRKQQSIRQRKEQEKKQGGVMLRSGRRLASPFSRNTRSTSKRASSPVDHRRRSVKKRQRIRVRVVYPPPAAIPVAPPPPPPPLPPPPPAPARMRRFNAQEIVNVPPKQTVRKLKYIGPLFASRFRADGHRTLESVLNRIRTHTRTSNRQWLKRILANQRASTCIPFANYNGSARFGRAPRGYRIRTENYFAYNSIVTYARMRIDAANQHRIPTLLSAEQPSRAYPNRCL